MAHVKTILKHFCLSGMLGIIQSKITWFWGYILLPLLCSTSLISHNFDVKLIIFSQFWPGAFSQKLLKQIYPKHDPVATATALPPELPPVMNQSLSSICLCLPPSSVSAEKALALVWSILVPCCCLLPEEPVCSISDWFSNVNLYFQGFLTGP